MQPLTFRHLLHDRSLRVGIGLAIAVAIPVAALFYLQFRSLTELQTASAVVLRQFSQETADRLVQQIEQDLRKPYFEALLRIGQADLDTMNLAVIGPLVQDALRRHPFVDAYYLWAERGPDHAGDVLVFAQADRTDGPPRVAGPQPGRLVDQGAYRFRTGVPEEAEMLEHVAALAQHKRATVVDHLVVRGQRCLMQFQLRFQTPARERVTSFAGFCADLDRLRGEHLPGIIEAELQAPHGPTGFPPLAVSLLDGEGRVIYESAPGGSRQFVDERRFLVVFFSLDLLEVLLPYRPPIEEWVLRTGYGARSVDAIARARIGPQVALMIALAVGMAFGVLAVTWAAAREVRLAELKSSFVSSVSHDLKTPLALIQLFAETLELGRLKSHERAHEYYRIINGEARKLTRLINNILDFSKIEAGLRRYRMAPVALPQLTSRVLGALESQFRHGHFEVRLEVAPDVPPVAADAEAVEQALDNLISNAMKYSGDRRDILVAVGRENAYAYVRVTDHGVGIPRRLQRRIFRKFYRIEAEDDADPRGCGLGLAIVDHVMRAHRGLVRVESEPGRGSTFSLCFPITPEGVAHEADSGGRGRAADAARPA